MGIVICCPLLDLSELVSGAVNAAHVLTGSRAKERSKPRAQG